MDYHCYQLLGACVCFIEACSSSSAFTWLVSCIEATILLLQFFLTNNKNHRSKLLLLLLLNLLLLQLGWFFILDIVVIMKRLESSDSLGALISLCPSAEEKGSGGGGSYRSFQSILDGFEDEDCGEESGCHITEKKRRLSVDQVKALEKNFEVENKLEPERKVKLAQELGLQPRQVAVWFQNRRARWKTKQLEKDYGMLKSNYEALKSNFEALQHENEALAMEVSELKEKLELTGNVESHVKEEERFSVKREDVEEEEEMLVINNNYNGNDKNKQQQQQQGYGVISMFSNDLKDGSDSDSSAILNDDNSSRSSGGIFSLPPASASAAASSSLRFNTCSSPGLQISESRVSLSAVAHKAYHQFFKMEEEQNDHLLNTDDESCNFFADDQAPTLQWYCGGDPWT